MFNISIESAQVSLTPIRYRLLHLLRPILCAKEYCKGDYLEKLEKFFLRMTVLQDLHRYIFESTHIIYFYKIRSFSSLFFEVLSANKAYINLLKYLFRAFEDSSRLLSRVAYLEDKDALLPQYKKELYATFEEILIVPVVKAIDDALRLKIHTLYIDKMRGYTPIKDDNLDINHFLKCEPLFFFGERISIKAIIEERLNKSFYNLTTFNPKDWQTYEDMKCLAYHLYGLELQDSLLPPQKVEQGLDLIFIVKHLTEFVANYHFSLHTQTFFERTNDTKKAIDVFGMPQAANSFHTHGIGIRNTVLNVVCKLVFKYARKVNAE